MSRSFIAALFALFFLVADADAQTATPTVTPATSTPTRTTTPSSSSAVIGLVFKDDNFNGNPDGREDGVDDVQLTLERVDVSEKTRTTKTDSKGKYRFDNLSTGSYLLTLKLPGDYQATTSTRRDIFVASFIGVGSFSGVEDFGLLRSDANDNDSITFENNNGTVTISRNGDRSSSRTSRVTVGRATATLPPTVTPLPTATATATATATPTIINRLRQLVSLSDNQFVSFTMKGQTDDNGQRADFEANGEVLEAKDMAMHLGMNGQDVEIIVVGPTSYERQKTDEYWQKTSIAKLRERHGVLSPLDVLALPLLADQTIDVRKLGYERVEGYGQPLQRYDIEVRRPVRGAGGAEQPTLAQQGGQPKQFATTTETGLEVLEGRVELWVDESYGWIHMAHLALGVPSIQRDQTGRLNPARMDVRLTFGDHNTAFTIREPGADALARPADVPVAARAPGAAAQAPVAPPAPAPAPAPARTGAQPSAGSTPEPVTRQSSSSRTPDPVIDGVIAGIGRELPERAIAADRASLALASAAGPRSGSRVEDNQILLDVPWRTRNEQSGLIPATDGSASLGMILEAYGVTVSSSDLQALGERYQESLQPGEALRIDTLTRLSERGSLRTVGSGVEWSAAVARDYLRRGYPVLALVKSGLLVDPPLERAPSDPDRYIVLDGFDGDQLLYQDPGLEGGERSVPPSLLDRAWAAASPPRQGQAFGFGTNLTGLIGPPGQTTAAAAATRVPQTTRIAATVVPDAFTVVAVATPPVAESATTGSGFGLQPVLIVFLVALAGGVGFVVSRLIR